VSKDCDAGVDLFRRIHVAWAFLVLPLMAAAGHYTSPVTLFFVVTIFAVFQKVHMSSVVAKFAYRIGQSGFAVYLLHSNWTVFDMMRKGVENLLSIGIPRHCALLAVSLIVFCACTCLYWAFRMFVGGIGLVVHKRIMTA